jgi:alpha-amylase
MKRISLFTAIVLGLVMASTKAADASAWKKRSVYQLLTDRFAKSSGDTSGCNLSNYCGGDFEGVKKNL